MNDNPKRSGTLYPGHAQTLLELVAYQEGGIVSRTLHRGPSGTLTLFAFDAGQALSEHTAPFDAFLLVLDGEGEVTVGGHPTRARPFDIVFMPGGVPHAVAAPVPCKMLLMMFRARAESSGS